MVSDAAFGRTACIVMPYPVSGEHSKRPVVHPNGNRHFKNRLGVAKTLNGLGVNLGERRGGCQSPDRVLKKTIFVFIQHNQLS